MESYTQTWRHSIEQWEISDVSTRRFSFRTLRPTRFDGSDAKSAWNDSCLRENDHKNRHFSLNMTECGQFWGVRG